MILLFPPQSANFIFGMLESITIITITIVIISNDIQQNHVLCQLSLRRSN